MKTTESKTTESASLETIYQLGINKTFWKSHMIHKINAVRKALGLEERSTALPEGTYDKEVTDKLAGMDFSTLGNGHNSYAQIVLLFAGYGLTPAVNTGDEEAPLLGEFETEDFLD
jgi:hypothetical protein